MKAVALISGGKDSCYNMLQCVMAGHEIVALANLKPDNKDELDSYMYQTVGHQGVELYSEALGIPLFRQPTQGVAIHSENLYTPTPQDEVEDLYQLLLNIRSEVEIQAVAVGAVLSDYQRLRVENVCSRLGLVALAYLWRRDQDELLQEMIDYNINAIIIKVAALGLNPQHHLGLKICEIQQHLRKMNEKYGLHICGEGGEYETFTLDCPLFRKSIVIDDYETVIHSNGNIAPIGYLNFRKLRLEEKDGVDLNSDLISRMKGLSIKTAEDYIADIDAVEELDPEATNTEESNCSDNTYHLDDDILLPKREREPCLPNTSVVVSQSGWCWVGGVAGESSDLGTATLEAMDKIKGLLQEANMKLSDLVRVCVYVKDLEQYKKVNSSYSEVISSGMNPPVRVCVETSLHQDTPVLVSALASSQPKQTIHVQALSHWAPANIGPYSQAKKVGDLVYVAGQIGLVPGSMELAQGGVVRECKLALRHISRLLKAFDRETQLQHIVQGVCFVTKASHIGEVRREWEKRTNNAIMDYIVVSQLPRGASVEWQVWAHMCNTMFQYEETGCVIGDHRVALRRRWNYDDSVSAVVCCVSTAFSKSSPELCLEARKEIMTEAQVQEVLRYILHRLIASRPCSTAVSLHLYYSGRAPPLSVLQRAVSAVSSQFTLSATLLPVSQLNHSSTFLSVSAVSH